MKHYAFKRTNRRNRDPHRCQHIIIIGGCAYPCSAMTDEPTGEAWLCRWHKRIARQLTLDTAAQP